MYNISQNRRNIKNLLSCDLPQYLIGKHSELQSPVQKNVKQSTKKLDMNKKLGISFDFPLSTTKF